MEEKLIETTDRSIKKIVDEGITTNNLEHLYKLKKINHMAKEDNKMYTDYGRRVPIYDAYGTYDRRGYDMKYRGHDHLDKIYDEYGRYMEGRSRYGASEETDKSFHYMVKALEDFIKVLYEEADTQQQKQVLRETLQRSVM